MITPGLVSVTFRQFPPQEIVALAVRAGLQSIEWGGDVHVPHGNISRANEVLALTKDAGLQVAAYGSYYRAGESEPDLSFDAVLETALALEAPTIRVWSGKQSSSQADADYRKRVTDDLNRIAEKAALHHTTISCEYHANTLCDCLESALDVLHKANRPNLKSYWQPRHGQPAETGVQELKKMGAFLSNIHVFHWWPDSSKRYPLEQGRARWKTFLDKAKNLPDNRHALLEFVQNNDPALLLQDAATLMELLK